MYRLEEEGVSSPSGLPCQQHTGTDTRACSGYYPSAHLSRGNAGKTGKQRCLGEDRASRKRGLVPPEHMVTNWTLRLLLFGNSICKF